MITEIKSVKYKPQKNLKQMEGHRALETYILYGGAKGGGKTAWIVNEVIQLSLDYPGNRGWIGCKQAIDFKKNALWQLIKYLPPEKVKVKDEGEEIEVKLWEHRVSDQIIQFKNGSVIMYGGLGNDEEAIQAINNMAELGWFAVDQAEQISERQFQMLCGQLRLNIPGIRYKGLLTANPEPGWLRDRFIDNVLPNHRFISALPRDNPFLPEDYIKNLRLMYPEELVKRLVEGDWDVDTEGNYLISYGLIRSAINRDIPQGGARIAGVDIARYGKDQSVFILREGNKVTKIISWAKQDATFSEGKLADLMREYKPHVTNIDTTGFDLGTAIFDTLKDKFAIRAIEVGNPSHHERFVNLRAEYYSNLQKRFEDGSISIPDHTLLASQLASIKYQYKNTKLQIVSKEVMRRKGIPSPDYADALMLAFIDSLSSEKIKVQSWG